MKINSIYSTETYKNNLNKPTKKIKFTGGMTLLLLLKLAKEGRSATIQGKKKIKLLNGISDYISRPGTEDYYVAISALSKIPNSFYDYHHQGLTSWIDSWFNSGSTDYVNKIRFNALRNLSNLTDSSYAVIQTKKEFLTSFLDNGHEISSSFLNQFKQLKDEYYKTFKQEIIDKCLYSVRYNQIRHNIDNDSICPSDYNCSCDSFNQKGYITEKSEVYDYENHRKNVLLEQIYNNLKLFSVLDKKNHAEYILSRKNIINMSKDKLEEYFSKLEKLGYLYKIPNLLDDYNKTIKLL